MEGKEQLSKSDVTVIKGYIHAHRYHVHQALSALNDKLAGRLDVLEDTRLDLL